MRCRDVDEALSNGPPDAARLGHLAPHLSECETCRDLVLALSSRIPEDEPAASFLLRIETLIGNFDPVRPLARARFFVMGAAIAGFCVVVLGAAPFAMNGWNALSAVRKIVIFATLSLSAAFLSISAVRQMIPGSRHWLSPSVLPSVVLLGLLGVFAAVFRPQSDPSFLANGIVCLKNGLVNSIAAGFLLWLLLRRGAILDAKRIGVSIGAWAGLIGAATLEINCPNFDVFHILAWHWGTIFLGCIAGSAAGTAVGVRQRRSVKTRLG